MSKNIANSALNFLNITVTGKINIIHGVHITQEATLEDTVKIALTDSLNDDTSIDQITTFLAEQAATNKAKDAGKTIFDPKTYQYTASENTLIQKVRNVISNEVHNQDMINIVNQASNISTWTIGGDESINEITDFQYNQIVENISNAIIDAYYSSISTMQISSSLLDALKQDADIINEQIGIFADLEGILKKLGITLIIALIVIIILYMIYKYAFGIQPKSKSKSKSKL